LFENGATCGGIRGLKGLSNAIKIAKTEGEAFTFMKNAGFADDIATQYSKELFHLDDLTKIEKGLLSAEKLQNSTKVDLTSYEDKGSIFMWVFIPDYSDAEGDTVTNFILRIGNDSSNYFSRTITTNNEGATFRDGWNLLRFDLNGATETGSVTITAIDYVRLTVTKSTSLAADTDWRVDDIRARLGDPYDVVYYTKYGWQTTALAYIEESTTTTDLIVGDTDEIELIGFKASELGALELKEYDDANYYRGVYQESKREYQSKNPSEALKKRRDYGMLPRFRS